MDLEFESGFGCVNLMRNPQILQMLCHGCCKEKWVLRGGAKCHC